MNKGGDNPPLLFIYLTYKVKKMGIDTITQVKEISADLKWSDKVFSRIGKISLLIWRI